MGLIRGEIETTSVPELLRAEAVDRVFHGARDKRLDLLGREAGRLGLHRHLRRHEIGKHVELRVRRDPHAVGDQQRTTC